ncbi:MAG: helix-turn-helix transcriptional regulator [Clostridia bacterium]|nr:helix-turn-helix transcriptional regulator [Clostridia bacterium]
MNLSKMIGQKVKAIRQQKGLTLKELGDRTGLSTGFLSQFERGISTIAVDSLLDIAAAMDCDIYEILENVAPSLPEDKLILRSYQRRNTQLSDEHQIHTDLSAFPADKQMMFRQITLPPYPETAAPASYKHQGEEFIYVLEGILTLFINQKHFELYPGDTAHFSSEATHIWTNRTTKNVTFLIANYPNPFAEK